MSGLLSSGYRIDQTRSQAVAWPLSEFNFKEHCFKKLTIAFEGRTEVVTILDAVCCIFSSTVSEF